MGFAIRGIVDQSPLKKSLDFHKLFVKLFAASLPVQHQRYWCAQGLIEAFDLRYSFSVSFVCSTQWASLSLHWQCWDMRALLL